MAVGESIIQQRQSQVNTFTTADAAWLAAAIDGEGFIRSYVSYVGADGVPVRNIRLGISMTNREFVEHFREIVGVGTVRAKKRSKENWSDQWCLEINGWVVVPILEQVLDWLIIKRERAIEVIAEMEAKRETV